MEAKGLLSGLVSNWFLLRANTIRPNLSITAPIAGLSNQRLAIPDAGAIGFLMHSGGAGSLPQTLISSRAINSHLAPTRNRKAQSALSNGTSATISNPGCGSPLMGIIGSVVARP